MIDFCRAFYHNAILGCLRIQLLYCTCYLHNIGSTLPSLWFFLSAVPFDQQSEHVQSSECGMLPLYNMHCTICTVVLCTTQACDHRSQTALLAAFRNGHVELVDWLLGHVAHLPSEQDCQKALLAPSPPATDLTPRRARCLEMISKVCKDIFYCRPVFCPFYVCMYIS